MKMIVWTQKECIDVRQVPVPTVSDFYSASISLARECNTMEEI